MKCIHSKANVAKLLVCSMFITLTTCLYSSPSACSHFLYMGPITFSKACLELSNMCFYVHWGSCGLCFSLSGSDLDRMKWGFCSQHKIPTLCFAVSLVDWAATGQFRSQDGNILEMRAYRNSEKRENCSDTQETHKFISQKRKCDLWFAQIQSNCLTEICFLSIFFSCFSSFFNYGRRFVRRSGFKVSGDLMDSLYYQQTNCLFSVCIIHLARARASADDFIWFGSR